MVPYHSAQRVHPTIVSSGNRVLQALKVKPWWSGREEAQTNARELIHGNGVRWLQQQMLCGSLQGLKSQVHTKNNVEKIKASLLSLCLPFQSRCFQPVEDMLRLLLVKYAVSTLARLLLTIRKHLLLSGQAASQLPSRIHLRLMIFGVIGGNFMGVLSGNWCRDKSNCQAVSLFLGTSKWYQVF